jgi:hypothetical protein
METVETYLERKHEELQLLNNCLQSRQPLVSPRSVDEVIQLKFQLTALLRAERALQNWTVTETAWSQASQSVAGPFEFKYDYQRADLEVSGPSFYEFDDQSTQDTVYTGSGMAAISALLLASEHVIGQADILVAPGSYSETLELVEGYAHHLRLITLEGPMEDTVASSGKPQILLLDSCAPASAFKIALRGANRTLDLLVFDTTCFSSSSGRIRRVLQWARKRGLPVVMVRSHTKLDSLGAEYGRLGSVVFLLPRRPTTERSKFKELPSETRKAIRLFGGAALPAHFPPYVGSAAYRVLTKKRVAAILRNARRTARYFASTLDGLSAELHFAHGLYVTLDTARPHDESAARQAAAKMSEDLSGKGFPIRHAGSFGFDFAASEWFHNATTDHYGVRVAVPDLPTAHWDTLSRAIAEWWETHQRRSLRH